MSNEEAIKVIAEDALYNPEAAALSILALKKVSKIQDLVEGTIDHFDRDDALDMLYEIKNILRNAD